MLRSECASSSPSLPPPIDPRYPKGRPVESFPVYNPLKSSFDATVTFILRKLGHSETGKPVPLESPSVLVLVRGSRGQRFSISRFCSLMASLDGEKIDRRNGGKVPLPPYIPLFLLPPSCSLSFPFTPTVTKPCKNSSIMNPVSPLLTKTSSLASPFLLLLRSWQP